MSRAEPSGCARCGAALSGYARGCGRCGARREAPRAVSGSLGGRFLVRRPAWEDGFSAAYEVEDATRSQRGLARVFAPGLSRASELLARIKQEGPRLRRAVHPGLAPLLYADAVDTGEVLLVWEESGAPSLAQQLLRGPLSVEDLAAWFASPAAALEALYAAGLAHGALCPAALRRTPEGAITDAGAAWLAALPGTAPAPEQVAGPWPYLAPERWRGAPPSPAADAYAFGAMLWHALVGRPPFEGKSASEAMGLHCFERPPRAPGLHEELDAVLTRALAKRPEERFATPALLWERLLATQREITRSAASARARHEEAEQARASTSEHPTTPPVQSLPTQVVPQTQVVIARPPRPPAPAPQGARPTAQKRPLVWLIVLGILLGISVMVCYELLR